MFSASTNEFRTFKSAADLPLRHQYEEKCERRGITAKSFDEFPQRFTAPKAAKFSKKNLQDLKSLLI